MDALERARTHWRRGDLPRAEAAYREALDDRPGLTGALLGLAGVLADQDRFDAALRVLDRLPPAEGEARVDGLRLRADVLRRSGRVPQAVETLRALLRDHPEERSAWQELALDLASTGRTEEADAALEDALRAHPGDARLLAASGMISGLTGRPALAVTAYERAIAAADGTEEPEAWRRLVRAHLAQALDHAGEPLRAIEAYRALLAEDPDAREARVRLGTTLWRRERFAEAARELAIAHERWPEDHDAAYYLADALRTLGRHEEARATFQASLERHPDCTSCLHGLAETHLAMGEPAEAARHLRHVLAAEPEDADALGLYAQARFDMGETADGRALFEEAIRRAPKEPRHAYNLGLRERETGRLEAATRAFDLALAAAPHLDRALYFAAVCRAERGLVEEALPLLARFVAAAPGSRGMVRADPLLDPLKVRPEWREIAGGGRLDMAAPGRPAFRLALAALLGELPASSAQPAGDASAIDAAGSALEFARRGLEARRGNPDGPPRYFVEAEIIGERLALRLVDARAPEGRTTLAAIRRTGAATFSVEGAVP